MKFTKLSVIAMLLVLCTLAMAACGGNPTETEHNHETEPTVTEPTVTEPAQTEETDPVVTEPVVTDPAETDPKETDPVVTDPVVTDPVETEPKETEPKETEPKETEPKETDPAVGPHTCVGATITSEPTCTYPGTKITICTICNEVMSEEVYADQLPCTPDEANPATCEKAQYCLVCKLVVVEPLGHKFVGAYADPSHEPTCKAEGTMTYTCERAANAEEHVEGSKGAAYTESVPTVAHVFEGETTLAPSSLLVPGSETGTCKWCGDGATNYFETGIYEKFDGLTAGSLYKDVFADSALATDFNPTFSGNGSYTIEQDEEGNTYLKKTGDGRLLITDNTGALKYETFEVSFDMHLDSMDPKQSNYSGGIFSINDGSEKRILALMGGKTFQFGKLNGSPYVLDNDFFENGEAEWVNISILINPVTYDYAISLDGVLVLYTTPSETNPAKHTVYLKNGDDWKTSDVDSSNSNYAFAQSGKGISALYFFHFSNWNVSLDNLTIRVPKVHECVTETVTEEPTCVDPGYSIEECTICGKQFEETYKEIPASGQHVYAIEAATCTEAKACTVCGEVAEAALGHEGTTIVPVTFCQDGSEKGLCTRCEKDIDVVIPAGLTETFENDTAGSKASFNILSQAFNVTVGNSLTVEEDKNGNKYWTKGEGKATADLTVKGDVLSGNDFTISFDVAFNNTKQGGILGLNSRTKQAMKSDGTSKYNSAKTTTHYDEMRVLSMKNEGGINFWGVDAMRATDGTTVDNIRLLNPVMGTSYSFKVEVYPTLADGLLTCIDYKIYINDKLVLETSGTEMYQNDTDGYSYPIKTIKWREYSAEDFNEKSFKAPRPDNKADGVQNPFYTIRAYHEGEEKWTQIESIHLFHYSATAHDIDNLGVSIKGGIECDYKHVVEDATCVATGAEWDECIYCGDVKNYNTLPVDETKHVKSELIVDEEATCAAPGLGHYECTLCTTQIGDAEVLDQLEHVFDEASIVVTTPPTFTTEGAATGTCAICQTPDLPIVLRRQVSVDFEDMEAGKLTADMLTSALSPFTTSYNNNSKAEQTIVADADGNQYWHVKYSSKGNGVSFADNTTEKLLNTNTWKLSMRVRFYNNTDDARFLSWRPTGGTERALLTYYKGKLAFGKNGNSSWHTVIAQGDTIVKDGVYQWINLAIEVDPVARTYKVYIEDELVLYTDESNVIYKLVDDAYVKQPGIFSDRTPFAAGGTVDQLYGFHQGICEMDIDDFKIEIVDYLPTSAE